MENSLSKRFPAVAKQWHKEKNGSIKPSQVGAHSEKKFWWQCKKGHEWLETVSHRSSGRGCPYCSGRRASSDNNLAIFRPQIVSQWHPTKNGTVVPQDVTPHSKRKYWWICDKGHEWEASPNHRVRGQDCPYCSGHRVCKDNCLAKINPKLARQWHKEKNTSLTAHDVMPGSNLSVWWKCSKGHEWQAQIAQRHAGSGCPYCSGRSVGADNNLAAVNPALAKEWHTTRNGSLTPKNVTQYSNQRVWWQCKKKHEWQAAINDRSRGSGCPFCAKRKACQDNRLQTHNPKLAREWHPSQNGRLTPKDISVRSERKVWWICKKKHSWLASVRSRNCGHGCPYCADFKPDEVNNLAKVNPNLAKEWHPEKNGKLTPEDVTPFSNKKCWWLCRHGHVWSAIIASRNAGQGCPECCSDRQKGIKKKVGKSLLKQAKLKTKK